MPHPSAFELPYEQAAIYATYARLRVRIWDWPPALRQRVMIAAMVAGDGSDAAYAAICEAVKVIVEADKWYKENIDDRDEQQAAACSIR